MAEDSINNVACPIPNRHQDDRIREILSQPQTISVVGMSPKPERPSYTVGLYLQDQGYRVVPVHPRVKEIAGLRVYPDLESAAADHNVSMVTLFVVGERTGPIIEQCARAGAKIVYFQPGAENADSEARARELGLEVFSGRCVMADHRRLIVA